MFVPAVGVELLAETEHTGGLAVQVTVTGVEACPVPIALMPATVYDTGPAEAAVAVQVDDVLAQFVQMKLVGAPKQNAVKVTL